jgi:hypothetical protein
MTRAFTAAEAANFRLATLTQRHPNSSLPQL